MLEKLKEELVQLHLELLRNDLVAWTSGNISARDTDSNLVVIKPSGVRYEHLTPENMVVVDLEGNIVDGKFKASSDTSSHCYIYRNMPDVNGVVHTHSRYATAFAVVGRSIPCHTTAMGDEFGGEIPCGDFALVGGDEIGQKVIEALRNSRSPSCLLVNHGVFAVGPSAEKAVKAAVMTEDNAAIMFLAFQLGVPVPIAPEDVDKLFDRYQNVYGQ
jgi:L-ribulose-5-phosphate 4-epimerase